MRLLSLSAVLALAPACHVESPHASSSTTAASSGGSSARSPTAARQTVPSAAQIAAIVAACVPGPTLVPEPSCALGALGQRAGAVPAACASFTPAHSPDVNVLSIVVAGGQCDFARALGIPSMRTALDGGAKGLGGLAKMYRDFEGPAFEPLADGRQVAVEARSLMLGGVVRWATLSSRDATFTTVVIQEIPLHDAPLDDAERQAIEQWDLAAMTACFDAQFMAR